VNFGPPFVDTMTRWFTAARVALSIVGEVLKEDAVGHVIALDSGLRKQRSAGMLRGRC